ncbi:hypothetical protein Y1Q_0006564 [Alligator mississippiensis]|uniref:Secreted protein n=1 Tax=Alligator mississippiensis TaxID=8496 RepID=A0A151NTP8_ALLMI|nr:hypothetical protein Y1Q_0006564 [Alligator mississippiensis]
MFLWFSLPQALCFCLDPSRGADHILLDVTARAIHALLDLKSCHVWAHLASQDLWLNIVQAIWDDVQVLEAFWMTQGTFLDLLEKLCLILEWQVTTMRQPFSTDI